MKPTCRGCHATIRWVNTRMGKAIPVDPERLTEWLVEEEQMVTTTGAPIPMRVITLVTMEGDVVRGYQGTVLTPGSREVIGYIPHWASCPQAAQFRKAKA